jgi:hypothetical protein
MVLAAMAAVAAAMAVARDAVAMVVTMMHDLNHGRSEKTLAGPMGQQ